MCQSGKITGISADGGWAEYLLAPAEALASISDELSADEAAPLLCAGITTFNSLRHSGARAGDLVAIHGIGGLGHLGIQFAAKLGFNTVAIGRGKYKEHLARKLGTSQYIDSSSANTSEQLKAMGGARVILATAPDSKAISSLVDGLGVE
jgi:D-arabinose 1-dehydrogenase-like Zn-dependent alcohol dehydrogenase